MGYPTILAAIDGSPGSKAALAAALRLANRFDAKVDLLALAPPAAPVFVAESYASEAYAAELDAAREAASAALAEGVQTAQGAGRLLDAAMIASPLASVQEAVATRALFADLIVTARRGLSSELTTRIIDGALFSAPAPLLLWPDEAKAEAADKLGARPTLAWDARPQASRAARAALPMIAGADTVAVVTVDDDGAPFEDEPGESFVGWLARRGVAAELRQLSGEPIAEVILADAEERNSDLLVMGGYGHSQLREAIFGGVTEAMLRLSPLPLLMAH